MTNSRYNLVDLSTGSVSTSTDTANEPLGHFAVPPPSHRMWMAVVVDPEYFNMNSPFGVDARIWAEVFKKLVDVVVLSSCLDEVAGTLVFRAGGAADALGFGFAAVDFRLVVLCSRL